MTKKICLAILFFLLRDSLYVTTATTLLLRIIFSDKVNYQLPKLRKQILTAISLNLAESNLLTVNNSNIYFMG